MATLNGMTIGDNLNEASHLVLPVRYRAYKHRVPTNMPKVKSTKREVVAKLVNEFGSDVLSGVGEKLKCIACDKEMSYSRKSNIGAHLKTLKHKSNLQGGGFPLVNDDQGNVEAVNADRKQFNSDLCEAVVNANIPLSKLENKSLRSFLEKYTGNVVPDESTLRKNYVDVHYNTTMNKIRTHAGNSKIWVSIDESTDVTGRYIASHDYRNSGSWGSIEDLFVKYSTTRKKTNSTSIAQFFATSLALLWPDGIQFDNVLLLVTDAAANMKCAARSLQIQYPNMIHLTCLCHGLHRIAEEIRLNFPNVDKLIANVRKIFLKAPSRVDLFRDTDPNLPLPPQPVLTRWGTWVDAALYYAEHFDMIKTIVGLLDPEDASTIKVSQHLLDDKSLRNNLIYISANFSTLPDSIKKLEERNLKVVDALRVFEDALQSMSVAYGSVGIAVRNKCEYIVLNNPGLKAVKKIRDVTVGDKEVEIGENIVRNSHLYKYAPVTSVEVERSFSKLKNVLSDKRLNLTASNIKKILVISCNNVQC